MPIRSVQRARRSGLQFDAASGAGYVLQMWQIRPEDWPLLLWEMDGYSLEEAKARAERLATSTFRSSWRNKACHESSPKASD